MNIIERVKQILLAPKQTWPVIATEQSDTATLYTQYIMVLAAIQAVAGFIGMSLFGVSFMGVSVRVPIMSGLVQMVLGYAMSLAMVYVVSMIANALAPSFGGQKNPMNALKLIAYSSTAAMLGGIFAIIPALGVLTLVAGLYSLYLLFLGVPVLMQVPREKALPFTAVLVVCAIVVGVIFGTIVGSFQGNMQGGPAVTLGAVETVGTAGTNAPAGKVTIETSKPDTIKVETPQGTVSVDTAKMEAWGKRMEEAGKKLERAQQSGDQAAMEAVMKEMAALQEEQPFSR